MLRINKDHSFSLLKPVQSSVSNMEQKRFPCPLLHSDRHKKKIDMKIWRKMHEHALSEILDYLYDFLSRIDSSPYTISINVDEFTSLLIQRIYEKSENRYVDFMNVLYLV